MTINRQRSFEKAELPVIYQRAMITPDTYSEDERTVEVIVATETPVRIFTWEDGPVMEILSMDASHIRMERINGGAPLLNSHNRWELEDQIGVVVDGTAKIVEGKLRCKVRFSSREDVASIVQDVKDGIYRNISVGYRVHKYEITKTEGQMPQYRAVDWEPYEVSLVAIPADANAGVRAEGNAFHVSIKQNQNPNSKMNIEQMRAEIARLRGLTSPSADETTQLRDLESRLAEAERAAPPTPSPAPVPAPAPAPAPAQNEDAIRASERLRVRTITDLARAAGLDEAFITKHVDDNTDLAKVRELVTDHWIKNGPKPEGNRTLVVTGDEADKRRDALTASLVIRSAQVSGDQITKEDREKANQYRGYTLLDLARQSLERLGVNTAGMDKMEIAGRAITSSGSDFPVLLEGTNRRILLANYQAIADTWRQFCGVGSVSDFREHKRLRMGSFGKLDQVNENREFKNKKISDADFEKISAQTYGNIINVSRQMIVNDDLNGFARLASMLGRAAARSIEQDVYALLAANPTTQDGNQLFSSAHGNIIAVGATNATAPTVAAFEAMRILMASQKDKDGNDFLDIRPNVGLFGLNTGGAARIVNGSQYDPDAANKLQRPNLVNGLLGTVVDTPRISGTEYYMFANPAEEPVIEVAFLDGVQTPFMDTEEGFTVDGMKWKIRLDYGVGAIGWKGAVKNEGRAS